MEKIILRSSMAKFVPQILRILSVVMIVVLLTVWFYFFTIEKSPLFAYIMIAIGIMTTAVASLCFAGIIHDYAVMKFIIDLDEMKVSYTYGVFPYKKKQTEIIFTDIFAKIFADKDDIFGRDTATVYISTVTADQIPITSSTELTTDDFVINCVKDANELIAPIVAFEKNKDQGAKS